MNSSPTSSGNDIPSGTVTFLFTDIEGSTGLWEQYPEAMKFALARHDLILRESIESNRGHVFKTMGDEFCAVFSAAPDALAAAVEAQRRLHNEDWGGMGDSQDQPLLIKVRIAIHTGAAESRDGDYFGPPLNRVARLLAAGHGGQTLLSAATDELVRDHLLDGAELRDMGEWQLKDITRPEHIYQLMVPDLPSEFSPLRTLDALRTNIPAQLTSFIGRKKEIAAIKLLIANNRLTTLIGPGGTGKTRLSLEIGADLLPAFPDGIWFVELAPLTDAALVPQAAATALGLREEPGHPLMETLSSYLRPKTALLILDNCEHLVEASARLAEALLRFCPHLRILTSSREALSIPGETTYRVPSLSVPSAQLVPVAAQALMQYEAVRLFIDRAQSVQPGFTVTDADAPIVAQICARLDGIPLAIELAAVRVKILKVDQIAARLDDRFRLLTGGSRTALPRQQTLRALIDWSYDTLPEIESSMLRRISVFVGGWTMPAAEALCEELLDFEVLDTIGQLANKSLIVVDAEDGDETRYHLLETIQQYAREKLAETNEGMRIRDLHLRYFLALAERAEDELAGPQIADWLATIETELDNIRAALEWSLNRDAISGLRLVNALLIFWEESGHLRDGLYWLEQLLKQPQAQSAGLVRARALSIQGVLGGLHTSFDESLAIYRALGDEKGLAFSLLYQGRLVFQEDNERAQKLLTESLALYRKLKDQQGMSDALNHLGVIATDMKDYALANTYLQEALTICREIKYVAGLTRTLADLGLMALKQEDYPAARRWLEESISTQNSIGKSGAIIYSVLLLGELSQREGDFAQARNYYERGIAIAEKSGISPWAPIKWIPVHLGYIGLRQGDIALARKHYDESLHGFKDTGITIGIIYTIEGHASLAVLQNQMTRAVKLFAWADNMREMIENSRPAIEQHNVDRDLATIHRQIDNATFIAAQEVGRAMSMDEIIALALDAKHG